MPCDQWNAKTKDAASPTGCRAAPIYDWEQRAFDLQLLRHAIGLGDEEAPLRQRLLPAHRFVDAAALPLLRRNASAVGGAALPGVVAVHAGSASGDEQKLALLAAHGLLRPGLAAHRRFAAADT